MVRHRWKYVGATDKARIYVDTSAKKTKIITAQYTYIHNGIYPFHDYDGRRRFRN